MQFKQRKELEKQLQTANGELNILKTVCNEQYSKCGIHVSHTDDINVLNDQIEQEAKRNIKKNKIKVVDSYLENIYKNMKLKNKMKLNETHKEFPNLGAELLVLDSFILFGDFTKCYKNSRVFKE